MCFNFLSQALLVILSIIIAVHRFPSKIANEGACLFFPEFLFILHPSPNAKSVIGFCSFRSWLFFPLLFYSALNGISGVMIQT